MGPELVWVPIPTPGSDRRHDRRVDGGFHSDALGQLNDFASEVINFGGFAPFVILRHGCFALWIKGLHRQHDVVEQNVRGQ